VTTPLDGRLVEKAASSMTDSPNEVSSPFSEKYVYEVSDDEDLSASFLNTSITGQS
jgi:hypothetical protein